MILYRFASTLPKPDIGNAIRLFNGFSPILPPRTNLQQRFIKKDKYTTIQSGSSSKTFNLAMCALDNIDNIYPNTGLKVQKWLKRAFKSAPQGVVIIMNDGRLYRHPEGKRPSKRKQDTYVH